MTMSIDKRDIFRRLACCFSIIFCLLFILGGCARTQIQQNAGFDPERYIADADRLIDEKDYDGARKILIEVKNRDTTKRYATLAHLKIADSYIKEGEVEIGIEEYRRFLELYPDNQYASYAQYQIAMAYFSQIESPDRGAGAAQRALEEFFKLKKLYPRNPYKEIVELRIQKARNVIADGEFMVGEFYFKKGSYNAALNRLERLLEEFPDYKRADEVLILIGRSYKALKMQEKAKEAFGMLIERYPSSRFVSEASREIK